MRKAVFAVLLSFLVPGVLWGQTAPGAASSMALPAATPTEPDPCPPCAPWNSRTAGHLMRRAGFSAPPEELDRFVEMGFEATLDELLDYEAVNDTEMEAGLAEKNYPLIRVNPQGRLRPNASGMQRWWLYRMLYSKRPLLEKMTYFWHDHFATSVRTVRQVAPDGQPYMMIQNDLLREHALGNFKDMVEAIAVDPAMLVWLDNRSNVKEHPNENWARELLELFTMGVGHYTDQDVVEAARAFTGWGLNQRTGEGRFYLRRHDYGFKTFLGEVGTFNGDHIIDIVFEQDATAEFVAGKLWEFLVYPDPSETLIAELADGFRESDYEIRPLIRAIFEHPDFFSERAYRALIKSPVELFVGLFRELGMSDPVSLPRLMAGAGQELFAPPDVSGWTRGVGWINTATLLARYNFLNTLASFRGNGSPDFAGWVRTHQLSHYDVVAFFLDAVMQNDVSVDTRYALHRYMTTDDDGEPMEWNINDRRTVDKKVRGVLYLILVLPAYQLN